MTGSARSGSGGPVDFAILGAGAIGSILGAHLWRAGHSVIMLVREARAQRIAADGLRITGLTDIHASVDSLVDWSQLRKARTLMVAMKTTGTDAALQALRHAEIRYRLFHPERNSEERAAGPKAFGTDPRAGCRRGYQR